MTESMDIRPALRASLTEADFANWYWVRAELQDFARLLSISAGGSKNVLTARIAAALAGRPFTEAPTEQRSGGRQLVGELSADTVIPPGQRCSQHLRSWFVAQVGEQFRFDAAMRSYIAAASGQHTLGDALQHWHNTRDESDRPIASQFEFNRFTRAWHEAHPDGNRDALLAAWQHYRRTPLTQRSSA